MAQRIQFPVNKQAVVTGSVGELIIKYVLFVSRISNGGIRVYVSKQELVNQLRQAWR